MAEEFEKEDIEEGFVVKDGGDDVDVTDTDDVIDPLEDPVDDKYTKAFAVDDQYDLGVDAEFTNEFAEYAGLNDE